MSPRRLTPIERALMLNAARHLHSEERCIYMVEAGDAPDPANLTGGELAPNRVRCIVCERVAESSDDVVWNSRGVHA